MVVTGNLWLPCPMHAFAKMGFDQGSVKMRQCGRWQILAEIRRAEPWLTTQAGRGNPHKFKTDASKTWAAQDDSEISSEVSLWWWLALLTDREQFQLGIFVSASLLALLSEGWYGKSGLEANLHPEKRCCRPSVRSRKPFLHSDWPIRRSAELSPWPPDHRVVVKDGAQSINEG